MQWVKLTIHFPSFFSYRIPDYSSQYALTVPLPSPSAIKLAMVATAIRTTGNVEKGKEVFYAVRDADVRIAPPNQIAINTFLIKRLKKKKNQLGFESTFGVREYVFFSEDIGVFIECDKTDLVAEYSCMLRYLGSGDSVLYVKRVEIVERPPEGSIKAVTNKEFIEAISNGPCLVYPVKDISRRAKFEQINPYSGKSGRNILERKYYVIRAKVKKGKNWKMLRIDTPK